MQIKTAIKVLKLGIRELEAAVGIQWITMLLIHQVGNCSIIWKVFIENGVLRTSKLDFPSEKFDRKTGEKLQDNFFYWTSEELENSANLPS